MSKYQAFVVSFLPVMLLVVTLMWWIEKPRYSWREMWKMMWEAK